MSHDDFEHEDLPGIPGKMPEGERLLWQGSPRWWALGRRTLFIVPITAYFLVLTCWEGIAAYQAQGQWRAGLHAAGVELLVGSLAIGVLCLLAWASARASVYSITNRRVVIRHGIALPMGLNLPLPQIESVAISHHADGTGELALTLPTTVRLSYGVNWPHVRSWQIRRPQPTLRAIQNVDQVAALLLQALASAGGAPAAPLAPAAVTGSSAPAAGAGIGGGAMHPPAGSAVA